MEPVIQNINFPAFQTNNIMAADAHLENMTNISECNHWKEIWWWENTFGFMIEFIPNTLVQFFFEKHIAGFLRLLNRIPVQYILTNYSATN